MTPGPRLRGPALVFLTYVIWSTTGPFFRCSGLEVASYVGAANTVGIALLLFFYRGRLLRHLAAMRGRHIFWLGACNAANNWAYFAALSLTSIGNAVVPHYAAPVLVALLSPLLLKEWPSERIWIALGLSMAGMLAVGWREMQLGSLQDLMGMALALGSAVAYAGSVILIRDQSRAGVDPIAITVAQSIALWLVALPFMDYGGFTWRSFGVAAAAGAFHLSLGAVIYAVALRRVKAAVAGVMGYTEIVFGLLWGALLFSEAVTGVDTSDFVVPGSSVSGASVASVTGIPV